MTGLPPELPWNDSATVDLVPRALVHRHREENVLLRRFARLPEPEHAYVAEAHVDTAHPFFFDHPLDHVPGMLLIEAARQFGVAVAHRYYEVPMEYGFVLSHFDVDFHRFADLDAPVYIVGRTRDRAQRRGHLSAMTFAGSFVQHNRALGTMTGLWRMAPARVLKRLRRG